MPLSEKTLVFLNELKSIDCNGTLGSNQDELIKATFKNILSSGDVYKIDEIENWLYDSQTNPIVAERILNVAHYQKAKFDAKNPLKMAHDSCGCGGDC
jgi:hypothetical protein